MQKNRGDIPDRENAGYYKVAYLDLPEEEKIR
jgi:hypothetical protein